MAHHGKGPFEAIKKFGGVDSDSETAKRNKLRRDLLDTTGFVGATGEFPDGMLNKNDEGELRVAIGIEKGRVVIDFGKDVHWLGMTPIEAAEFASTLLRKAREAGRRQGQTIAFTF